MNCKELIARFRTESNDSVEPHRWADADIIEYLNEAVEEAAIRKNLIFEYRDTDICEVAVTAGTASYSLHEAVVSVEYMSIREGSNNPSKVLIVTREKLDECYPDWRTADQDTPEFCIVDDTSFQLVPTPYADCTVRMDVFRTPTEGEKMAEPVSKNPYDKGGVPPISGVHHRHLVDWALYRAYSNRDVGKHDGKLAGIHFAKFEDYFGSSSDANRKRKRYENRPQVNKLW